MSEAPPRSFRFDGTISLGNILIVVGMLGALGTTFLGGRDDVRQALRDIASLQRDVATQAEQSRRALQEQAAATREAAKEASASTERIIFGLQGQLAEKIKALETWNGIIEGRAESHRITADTRFNALNEQTVQNRVEIQSLRAASGLNLPGSRAVR